MPTKTDRILSYLPRTFQTSPRPPVLYPVVDAFGQELLLAENSLSAVMLSHWVDFADKGAEAIDDLQRIASLYGLAPRDDETVEEFREHLKHYVRTFLEGTVTVQGILRIAAEVLRLHIADSNADLDAWWQRRGLELVTVEARGDDAAEKIFGVPALKATGNAALPAQVKGTVPLSGVTLPDPSVLHLAIDGGSVTDVPLPSGPVNPGDIESAVNTVMGKSVARLDGSFLILASPTIGASSRLEVRAGANDAAGQLLGLVPRIYQGSDAVGAILTGKVDLSAGVDLSHNRYLRLSVDATYLAEVDCADPHAANATTLNHMRDAINSALGVNVASHDGKYLIIKSPSTGFRSSVALQSATAQDARAVLFGPVPPLQTGQDARPARVVGSRDLSHGIDLSTASNIQLTIDGTSRTINCAGSNPAQTQTLEIVTAINAAFGVQVASPDGTGIAIASRTAGPTGSVVFGIPASGDATEIVFGIGPRLFLGSDATAARIVGQPDLDPPNPPTHRPGVDLAAQYVLALAVDGGAAFNLDLRPQTGDVRAVKPAQLVSVINQAVPGGIASSDGHHLILTSSTTGSGSSLEIKPLERIKRRRFVTRARVTDDAAQAVFGTVSLQAQGTPPTTAELVGTADLSYGIDLRDASLLRITIDDGPPQEINCAGARPRGTQLADIIAAINAKFPSVADTDAKHLILRSPSSGAGSRIVIEPPTVSDPTDALPVLGFSPATIRGSDATRVTFTSLVDLAAGVDLPANASISLEINGVLHEINLAAAGPLRRSAGEIATLINLEFKSNVCIVGGTRLVVSSPLKGAKSTIGFKHPTGPDATALVFGVSPDRLYQGEDSQPARMVSSQVDLSKVDLSTGRLLRVSVNGGATKDVDCAAQAATPSAATLNEIVKSINAALPGLASASPDGKHLVLTSPTAGFGSTLQLETRAASDASQKLFGTLDPVVQGQDPGPATLTGIAAVPGPIDLSKRNLVRLSVNGRRAVDIDVAGLFPNATSLDEVAAAINRVFPGMAAVTPDDKLKLTAPSTSEGSSLALLPLRYLELVEYPPQPVQTTPITLHAGEKLPLTNTGAADSSLGICLTTTGSVVDPTFLNLTSGTSLSLHTALYAGETACLDFREDDGLRAEIVSADGTRRLLPLDKIRTGSLSSSVTVPFQGERRLTRDSSSRASVQLNNPQAPNVVVLRARQELVEKTIVITVRESDLSSLPVGPAPALGAVGRWIGRVSASTTGSHLLDHAGQSIAELRAGASVNLSAHHNQVVQINGHGHHGKALVVVAESVAQLFDVELHFADGSTPDGNDAYRGVTIGEGPGENSLTVRINAGKQFRGFSHLVKAEELSKGSALILPQGSSDWIYLECEGPRYDQAQFDPEVPGGSSDDDVKYRFPGKFCEQVGVFNISRYARHGSEREDSPSPLYGPVTAGSAVQVTARWMNYQPGSFVVNLPEDLDERFGGQFNHSFFASRKDPAETFAGVVAEPDTDTNNLVTRIKALPSRFVTAQQVDRVPLGWSPVPMPFRKPQSLTRNPGDDRARIYLTEEGLSGAIELTAIYPGAWGDHIAVNARPSGPAIYDVAIFFKGARYENARQLVKGPLPALATDLVKPGPIGVLQAKAAGVLADVTRDGTERVPDPESNAPFTIPPISYLEFDGKQSYVEVPNNKNFSVSADGLTVSVWMRPDTLKFPYVDGTGYVHWLGVGEGSGASGQQEWAFRIYSEGNSENRENRISFYLFNPEGKEGVGSYFQEPVMPGQWIHVVGIADRQNTYIYKNGVLKKCDQYAASGAGTCEKHPEIIQPRHGSAPLRIGHRDEKSFFLGALKKVRIWNRPLMGSEVADLYARDTVPQNGLVAEYRMDEGDGNVVHDSLGGNDGTIVGATWKSE